jgi:DegV family protein with EDD domain
MASAQIRIVTDTTSALPQEYARAHHIEVVPQIINFGAESFLEGVTLDYVEFIRHLKASSRLPKTAAPQPGDLIEAYRKQLADAPTILSIHPSAEVSGTVRSAWTAKNDAFPEADIRVLDSRLVAGNLASMVIAATEWAERGIGVDRIVTRLQKMIPRGRIYFLVATLEYLQRGGRIGGASALIGTALQIKPILELKNGRVEPLEKVRTYHHALARLKELAIEQCPRSPDAHLCVMHADDRAGAEQLAQDLQSVLKIGDIPIYPCSASITTHTGPGALAVGFFI